MRADEITLTLPRERPFYGIANLVLGGIASRLSVTYEDLEDLQIALESLLERDGRGGDVTLTLRVRDDAIEASVGPFDSILRDELERDPGGDVRLRRILETVVDDVAVGEQEDGHWVKLTKRVTTAKGGAG